MTLYEDNMDTYAIVFGDWFKKFKIKYLEMLLAKKKI